MNIVVVLLVILLLFSGGFFYGPRYGWGAYQYGGGTIGLVLAVILILYLSGRL